MTMQFGQIERIWFEDDRFLSYPDLSESTDETDPPAQGTNIYDTQTTRPITGTNQFQLADPGGELFQQFL